VSRHGTGILWSEVFGINSPADNPAWLDAKQVRVKSRSQYWLPSGPLCLSAMHAVEEGRGVSSGQIVARVIDVGSRWRCEIPGPETGRSAQSLAGQSPLA